VRREAKGKEERQILFKLCIKGGWLGAEKIIPPILVYHGELGWETDAAGRCLVK